MRARLFRAERVSRLRMQVLALLGLFIFFGGLTSLLYYSFLPYAGFEFVGAARIGAVVPDSPAEAAGLEVGDEVLSMDGVPFSLAKGTSGVVLAEADGELIAALLDYGSAGGQVLILADVGILGAGWEGPENLTFWRNLAHYAAE